MFPTATIERPATKAFTPTFAELLASEEPELMRWVFAGRDSCVAGERLPA
jgi:hypothetical protein